MQLEGTVQNGVVVLDDKASIPDGTRVEVTPIVDAIPTVGQRLEWLAGAIPDMPADFAPEHDHYIHGSPKRDSQGGE